MTTNSNYIRVVTDDKQEHTIRVCGTKYNPHFFGVDICKIMDIVDFNKTIKDTVNKNHKTFLKNLLEKEKTPYEICALKLLPLLGSFDLKTLSHNDERVVVLSEPGVINLLNGSKNHKNKKIILESIQRFIYAVKYENNDEYMGIFTFASKFYPTFDTTSNWLQDLWYPLSAKIFNLQDEQKEKNRPIILTSNLLEWMGYKGQKESDKQKNFCRLLDSTTIPYNEITYRHHLVREYPGVHQEFEQLKVSNNLKKKKWICMDVINFKKAILKLTTKNADAVLDYYFDLEEIMLAYLYYTPWYIAKQLEETQKARREAEEARREAEEAHREAQKALREAEEAHREAQKALREAEEAYQEAQKALREAEEAHQEAQKALREAEERDKACFKVNTSKNTCETKSKGNQAER
jgi:hypothetical protein